MEALRYHPWQRRAALGRLLLGGLGLGALLWLLWLFGEEEPLIALILGLFALALGPLYLWRTGLVPLLRGGLEVRLEPEGVRIGGRLYPRSAFRGLKGPQSPRVPLEPEPGKKSPWREALEASGRQEYWNALKDPHALFRLDFGEEVPLPLDLPGWDRLLRHLGLDWTEHRELSTYLGLARGLAWLNGLLYPPEEALEVWEQARRRYRRQMALFWAGLALVAAGLFVRQEAFSALLVLTGFGLWAWSGYSLFGPNPFLKGWATRYNPLQALREEV
ncbi:hypothetical protein [Thermus filiformis]|uniref:hypothetical protein n=1 Tax=Thermus filiformis TaxID=276 RepID=UPI000530CD64|nr:hypothetical protein [Thermus filiformis]